MLSVIKRLLAHFSRRRWIQCILLLILMVLSAIAELLSIGSVIPFIGIITNPDEITNFAFVQAILIFLNLKTDIEILLFFTVTFISLAVLSGSIRVLYIWLQSRLTHLIGSDLSVICYRKSLYQPYVVHLNQNSSEIVSTIFVKINKLSHRIILNLFAISSASILILSVFIAFLFINFAMTAIIFSSFGLIYFFISLIFKNALRKGSITLSFEQDKAVKLLQESLGGIRDLLIDGSHELYIKLFRRSEIRLRYATANLEFIALSPRYIIEMFGIMVFAIYCSYSVSKGEGDGLLLPIFASIAVAAVRLLPYVQGLYAGVSGIQAHINIAEDILALLEQDDALNIPENTDQIHKKLNFDEEIRLSNLSFSYPGTSERVLSGIDLIIPKGSKVGIIGLTGSGKSTMMDILMGLLLPTNGQIKIDHKELDQANQHLWRKHVVHVPQTIFLSDVSILENIAFGTPKEEIDHGLVKVAAKKAQIHDFISSLDNGYDTVVGERGAKLSGGQRQRIGIARAMLKQSKIMFLDEATNALDDETETEVMNSLYELDSKMTLIMVAHRKTTLKHCSMIVEIKDGKIYKTGSYEEMIGI